MEGVRWNIELPNADWYRLGDERLDGLIREVQDQDVVAIDTETTGLVVWKDMPLYWSMAWGDNRRVCMPIETTALFQRTFSDPSVRWVLANAKFDMHMLANIGVVLAGECVDTAVMHALLYEEESHKLKDMARSVLGWRWSDFFDTFQRATVPDTRLAPKIMRGGGLRYPTRKEELFEMFARFEIEHLDVLVDYASNDAYGTLRLYEKLKLELEAIQLNTLYPEWLTTMAHLFFLTEAPFTKVLWQCERNGVYANKEYLDNLGGPMEKELAQHHMEMVRLSGNANFNPNSDDQVRDYFLNVEKLKPLKMTKGGKSGVKKASVDKKFLEHYSDESPMAHELAQYSKLEKLLSTYIRNVDEHRDGNGRMHTRFNQDIARCMPAGELVLTSRGYLPVEQVVVDDFVIGHSGKPRRVVDVSEHSPQPIYRTQMSNGLELRTTGNHQYRTKEGWLRADCLTFGDVVTVHSNKEQWLPIEGWDAFDVSSWGRIRNSATGTIRALQPKNEWGHLKVTLSRNGAQKRGEDRKDFSVHQLVLRAFCGELQNRYLAEVRHLNGISWDNTIGNLKYGTSHENRQDALKHGTMSQRRAGRTVLTEEAVQDIRSSVRPTQTSPTAKLTFADAVSLREAYANGEHTAALAVRYGVSFQAARNIILKKTHREESPNAARSARSLAEKYGVSEGYIREVQSGAKWKPEDYIEGIAASFFEAHVTSVCIAPAETTYGLTVEEDHSHVTGGVVTHNTGRLSSSNPNLQNVPTPDKDKFRLRGAFQPQPGSGNTLIVSDYAALEMRLLACATVTPENPMGAREMIQIFLDGKDIHMGSAELVYGDLYEQRYGFRLTYDFLKNAKKIDGLVKEGKLPESERTEQIALAVYARNAIKTVSFGLNYGMKEKKLAHDLNISVDEALAIIDRYLKTYPAIDGFYKAAIAETQQTGYSTTLLGRRRVHKAINSYNTMDRWSEERKAVNNHIQGTAADAVRLAMINLSNARLDLKYGCNMLLQIHDELMFECPEETADEAMVEIRQIMEHPFPTDLIVPLTVSIGKGPSWDRAK